MNVVHRVILFFQPTYNRITCTFINFVTQIFFFSSLPQKAYTLPFGILCRSESSCKKIFNSFLFVFHILYRKTRIVSSKKCFLVYQLNTPSCKAYPLRTHGVRRCTESVGALQEVDIPLPLTPHFPSALRVLVAWSINYLPCIFFCRTFSLMMQFTSEASVK